MNDRKDPREKLHEDKGAVLPVAPATVPMPKVKPTEGARPDKPTKAKE